MKTSSHISFKILIMVVMLMTFVLPSKADLPSASTSYAKDAQSIVVRGYENVKNSVYTVYYMRIFNLGSPEWNIALHDADNIIYGVKVNSVEKMPGNHRFHCYGHDDITDEDMEVRIILSDDQFKVSFWGKNKHYDIQVDNKKDHPTTFVLFNDQNTLDPDVDGWKKGNPKKFKQAMQYILNQKIK